MISRPIKISLDYHGVVDQDINYWREFCYLAKKRGHRIYIISGGPQVMIRQKLAKNQISYDVLWCVLDYCLSLKRVIMTENGKLTIADDLWNSVKGFLCHQNRIDLHIDDTLAYKPYFLTPFCWYNQQQKKCYIEQYFPFFSQDLNGFIKQIEELVCDNQ